jgi:hypothetical protein
MKRFSIFPEQLISTFTFVLLLVTVSCSKSDYTNYPVSYNVINSSDSGIKVIFNGLLDNWGGYERYTLVEDSIVYINAGEEKMLFIANWGNGPRNPENGMTIKGMKTIRIYRNDSIQSTSDFMQTSYWSYKELNKARGEINLVVKTTDFNP